jgi:hypothetical protein
MITYVVLSPGDIATGATFSAERPSFELAADALAALNGFPDRDAMLNAHPGLVIGFAPLH